jgi:adenosine deaminase
LQETDDRLKLQLGKWHGGTYQRCFHTAVPTNVQKLVLDARAEAVKRIDELATAEVKGCLPKDWKAERAWREIELAAEAVEARPYLQKFVAGLMPSAADALGLVANRNANRVALTMELCEEARKAVRMEGYYRRKKVDEVGRALAEKRRSAGKLLQAYAARQRSKKFFDLCEVAE